MYFYYDVRGNMRQRKDTYITVKYTYDGLDRVLTATATNSEDGSSVAYTYVYDEPPYPGRLTRVIEPDRTIRYDYDAAGRITGERTEENGVAAPLVTTYGYDANGAVSDVIYPAGLHVEYGRDPATQEVVQVKGPGTAYASQIAHVPGGPVRTLQFGNGLSLSQTFNRRHEPATISSGPYSSGYGMSPAGDVTSVVDGDGTRLFKYDVADRLVTLEQDALAPWPSQTFWAVSATASSSGWGGAAQASGAPDTSSCGNYGTAWGPSGSSTTPSEWLQLVYAVPVLATEVRIHETYSAPFVTRVDLIDVSGVSHTVWSGSDQTACGGWLNVTFPETTYLVQAVKITTQKTGLEEIDAVALVGRLPAGRALSYQHDGAGNRTAESVANVTPRSFRRPTGARARALDASPSTPIPARNDASQAAVSGVAAVLQRR